MASQQRPSISERPRLSLQIQTLGVPALKAPRRRPVIPGDPTAFNTRSNALTHSSPSSSSSPVLQSEPVTAIHAMQAYSLETPAEYRAAEPRSYPETPLMDHAIASIMTASPPLSNATTDSNSASVFTFSASDVCCRQGPRSYSSPISGRTPRPTVAPYTHPRSLRSILRNSPLPPGTTLPPPLPRRQSLRLQEKAAKRVGYNSPLTQEIRTSKYVKSHIDLFADDASPAGLGPALSPAWTFTANEILDGSHTPGPPKYEGRRRTAGLAPEALSPAQAGGFCKRPRLEHKRQWIWTIGQDDGDDDDDDGIGGAVAALRAGAARASPGRTPTHATGIPGTRHLHLDCPENVASAADADTSDPSTVIPPGHHPEPPTPSHRVAEMALCQRGSA